MKTPVNNDDSSQAPSVGVADANEASKTAMYRAALYAVLPRNAASDAALEFAAKFEEENKIARAALRFVDFSLMESGYVANSACRSEIRFALTGSRD